MKYLIIFLYLAIGIVIASIAKALDDGRCDDDIMIPIILMWPLLLVFGLFAVIYFVVDKITEKLANEIRQRKEEIEYIKKKLDKWS